jgi:ABC-type sugar transport system permease subunit
MAFSLWLVFHRFNPLRATTPEFVGAANIQQLLTDPRVWGALKTTFVYAGIAVPLSFVLGLAIALLFNNDCPGVRLFRGLTLVPLMVMPVAVGLTFQMLFNYQYGLFNWILVGAAPAARGLAERPIDGVRFDHHPRPVAAHAVRDDGPPGRTTQRATRADRDAHASTARRRGRRSCT